ncbi:MAG: cytochrome c, partial [Anaerolineae bacterium]|nr:cytochrome c [Anaerolineae bacterium]
MKRWMVILTLVVSLLVVLAALPAAAQDDEHGEEADHSEDVLRGAAVYATYCQACHGPTGEALGTGAAFAAITYDHDTAHEAILAGGALMP